MPIDAARLNEVRLSLLHLHKTLLDHEREEYEWRHGQVSSGKFLQLALADSQFAWLHYLSELIVKIDEMTDSREPATEEDVNAVIVDARKLLDPASINNDFAEKYQNALQKQPAVVMAHQRLREAVK